ncbi:MULTISPECIES: OmpA family protein [unclassified Xanthomonas]|uniref:OmpA family protein n=1 Tax=unclassified Xanthomonas TaxID=2643310 RepID=UPI002A809AA2|nr:MULTISPECIES: OmpA family protein [unclassified Xanthomonas]MDY4295253.1 OmpA family protein [Xanthomonas sp. LF02-5]MDY4356249.1 OmpA family protein [Xanthomonas sp. LF04-12]
MNLLGLNELKVFFLVCAFFMASSCASFLSVEKSEKYGGEIGFSDPGDFKGVNFKPGEPSINESLLSALSELSDQKALEDDLLLLKMMPDNINLRVLGFTDSVECREYDCVDLSLRRARALHEWLLNNGVSKFRLSEPYGFGSARPVGDNKTEEGRARNRRAYISYEDVSLK